MNNKEKRQFIIDAHRLYMEFRPYDGCSSIEEMKNKEDEFWTKYSSLFYHLLPKSLFKYRKPTEDAIANLENDTAWFSHPSDFDDTVDSVINNDIESELKEFEEHPELVTIKLAAAFINALMKPYGAKVDQKQIEEALPLFNSDGTFNEDDTRLYLEEKMPGCPVDECIGRLKENTSKVINDKVLDSAKGFLTYYLDLNSRTRSETFTFSLAEEGDNQAMWGLYADESKGFCIEYSFPKEDFLGQRMLLNLFPIYYGEKPLIKFFDVLIKGLYAQNNINGISYEDYQDWFLSAYTKDKTYEWQKEWRITFDNRMGGNLQHFPFAKSIILGERMTEENKKRLIEIAKKKGLSVYQRVINKTGSQVVLTKLCG